MGGAEQGAKRVVGEGGDVAPHVHFPTGAALMTTWLLHSQATGILVSTRAQRFPCFEVRRCGF